MFFPYQIKKYEVTNLDHKVAVMHSPELKLTKWSFNWQKKKDVSRERGGKHHDAMCLFMQLFSKQLSDET